jgi:hypothetical protein
LKVSRDIITYLGTKGDTLFADINNPEMFNGSVFGSHTALYVDHVTRYNLSKQLVMNVAERERNQIRLFTDLVVRKLWKYRLNYAVKAGLGAMFLYSLCKANETHNLLKLKRKVDTNSLCCVYSGAITSFFVFAAVTAAI